MRIMTGTVSPIGLENKPPVVLLGGAENAVACARRFLADGITTVVVQGDGAPALHCRGVVPRPVASKLGATDVVDWLTGDGLEWSGAVVIPLSDQALLGVVEEYPAVVEHYRPALLSPEVVAAVLDKQRTLELAREAGVDAPRQWIVPATGLSSLLGDLEFPVILKPRRNFELLAIAGCKYIRVDHPSEMPRHVEIMESLPSGYVVNEFIPGGDDLLTSYNAVRAADGRTLLEFTKRVDRRYPPNEGGATFHELVDLPATAAAGRRFFDHVGAIGMANVEFKTDPRTGGLKLIECNHRLTAAIRLAQDNGIDVAGAVYRQALGLDVPASTPRWGATLWYPVRDLRSWRRSGEGIRSWSRRPKRSGFPYWSISDPGPSWALWSRTARAHLRRLRRR